MQWTIRGPPSSSAGPGTNTCAVENTELDLLPRALPPPTCNKFCAESKLFAEIDVDVEFAFPGDSSGVVLLTGWFFPASLTTLTVGASEVLRGSPPVDDAAEACASEDD